LECFELHICAKDYCFARDDHLIGMAVLQLRDVTESGGCALWCQLGRKIQLDDTGWTVLRILSQRANSDEARDLISSKMLLNIMLIYANIMLIWSNSRKFCFKTIKTVVVVIVFVYTPHLHRSGLLGYLKFFNERIPKYFVIRVILIIDCYSNTNNSDCVDVCVCACVCVCVCLCVRACVVVGLHLTSAFNFYRLMSELAVTLTLDI